MLIVLHSLKNNYEDFKWGTTAAEATTAVQINVIIYFCHTRHLQKKLIFMCERMQTPKSRMWVRLSGCDEVCKGKGVSVVGFSSQIIFMNVFFKF
jgi:hypothetical protein